MKKIFLMAVALCSFAMVSAQSADEVTAKYNDAVAAYDQAVLSKDQDAINNASNNFN